MKIDHTQVQYYTSEDVKRMRQRLGLTQTTFWNRLGVTQSAASRYESGRPIPKQVQLLIRLAYDTEHRARTLFMKLRARERDK